MRFLNFKNWENLLNIEHFFMTSLPVKMTSYQKTVWSINRFWVELSSTKIFWWFPYHNPHSKVKRAPYFPIFNSEKQRYRSQINEQVTVLNQVEYGEFDEHISFLIFWCLVFLRTKDFLYQCSHGIWSQTKPRPYHSIFIWISMKTKPKMIVKQEIWSKRSNRILKRPCVFQWSNWINCPMDFPIQMNQIELYQNAILIITVIIKMILIHLRSSLLFNE